MGPVWCLKVDAAWPGGPPRRPLVGACLLRLRQELEDALGGGSRCSIGGFAPSAVKRALRNVVLLRDGAELLAVGIGDVPVDDDRLLAILASAHRDLAFDRVGLR